MSESSADEFYSELVIHQSFDDDNTEEESRNNTKGNNKLDRFLKKVYVPPSEVSEDRNPRKNEGISHKLSFEIKRQLIKNKNFFKNLSMKFYSSREEQKSVVITPKPLNRKKSQKKSKESLQLKKLTTKKKIKAKSPVVVNNKNSPHEGNRGPPTLLNLNSIWGAKESILQLMMAKKLKAASRSGYLKPGKQSSRATSNLIKKSSSKTFIPIQPSHQYAAQKSCFFYIPKPSKRTWKESPSLENYFCRTLNPRNSCNSKSGKSLRDRSALIKKIKRCKE